MKSTKIFSAVLGLMPMVSAHMQMSYPPSLRFKDNPNVNSGNADFNLVAPLHGDGSDFPCKGYQSDLGTPAGKSVVNWAAGGSYNFTIIGGASHGGGSCQASLSYDKGKTFTVIHSFIGNCPTAGSFNFNMPSDAPAGAALFAWTWYNKIGNREIYMNCASITVTGSGTSKRAGTSFSSRPGLFVANLNNGCTTTETMDVTFPNPGPDVTGTGGSDKGFSGTCKAVNGIGDGSSGSSSSGGSSPAANSGAASPLASPAQSSSAVNAGVPSAASSAMSGSSGGGLYTAASSAAAATSTSAASGSLSLSADGSCGGNFGCKGSVHGSCCSQWGFCGSTDAYCGTGCNPAFGTCGSSTNSTGSTSLTVSTDKTCGGSTSNTCQGSTFGNCCSQYGYCGSTSDYCGTGCQSGFGSCVSGSVSSANASSAASSTGTAITAISAPTAAPSTTTVISTTTVMLTSNNSVAPSSTMASGFVGVTQAPSSPTGFITMTRTTSSTPEIDGHTLPPSLRTTVLIVPTTPSNFLRWFG